MRTRNYIIGLVVVVFVTAGLMAMLLFGGTDELTEDLEDDVEEVAEPEPEPAKKPEQRVETPRPPQPAPLSRDQRAGAVLQGVITSTSGKPVAADIIVAGPTLPQPRRVRAGSDGTYKVMGLPTGPVTVAVRAAGFRPVRINDFRVDGPTQKSFTLEPISGVLGKVIAPDGRPARGVWVRLSHSGGQRTMRTDGEGRFTWDKPGVDLASITAVAYSPWHGPSEQKAPQPDVELVLTLTAGARVEGKVVDSRGAPVVGASVGVERCKGEPDHAFGRRFWPPTRTDESGRFKLPMVRPGSCDLTADSPKHAIGRAEGVWTSSGALVDNVVITLGSGGTVRGRVTIKGKGDGIAGARVVVFEPGSHLPPSSAMTDKEGNYALEGIAPGRHSVRVQHKSYLTELRGGVDVPEQGEVTRDFALRVRKAGEKFAFQGIGATLGRTPRGVIIRKTMAGSPASKFGLKDGDLIVAVDHQPMGEKGISSVVESIRGEAGTPVMIEVERPGKGRMTISVERGDVIVK